MNIEDIENMSDEEHQYWEDKAEAKGLIHPVGSGWGELEMIAEGLRLNGFQLSRGTCQGSTCEWATLDIHRIDHPTWPGVWQAVESDGEVGTVIRLISQAMEEWREYKETFLQNK
jgi:hypothetical protein